MFVVDALFIRVAQSAESSIKGFRSALQTLDRGRHLTVLHDPSFPWLVVKHRPELDGDQQALFVNEMTAAGLGEMIQFTWDDQWSWTTYRHDVPGKPPRRFVLHPEPDEEQSPWLMDLGEREPWESYPDVPGDSDLQAMAALHQLPGITHTGRLEFPDQWEIQRDLQVPGSGPIDTPAPIDPNSSFGLLQRANAGEVLSISDALKLMQSFLGMISTHHVAAAMRAHQIFAPKKRLFRQRAVLKGPEGQKLVPVLSSLDQVPGVSEEQMKKDFSPMYLKDLLKQLDRDEGLLFDPLRKDASLQIDPKDVPNFRKMITDYSAWLDEMPG